MRLCRPRGREPGADPSSCQALLEGTLWAEWALEAEKTADQALQVLVLEVGCTAGERAPSRAGAEASARVTGRDSGVRKSLPGSLRLLI